jgi:hypothetical protein
MSENQESDRFNAPFFDGIISAYDNRFLNPAQPSDALVNAMDPLFRLLAPLKPCLKNDEAKVLWITVPRGSIEDWESFDDAKEYDEVKTYAEYEDLWKEYYPDEVKWYRLVLCENKEDRPSNRYRAVAIDNTAIVNADLSKGTHAETWFTEEPVVDLLPLLVEAARKSMDLLKEGTYNDFVSKNLPCQHRIGVLKRSDAWRVVPDARDTYWKNMDEETYRAFKSCLPTNAEDRIGRLHSFTANDFFRACYLGYKACGYNLTGMSPEQAYLRYADGRDEGLTGTGFGLNEGPGIDFDSPSAWDNWYNSSRGGGHPWEVIRGGNSTHVDLYVVNDSRELGYLLQLGKISEKEYEERAAKAGYYFELAGIYREWESIRFFVALRSAGLPVVLNDADEIATKFDGTGYIGIVPHRMIPAYCESLYPEKYGRVVDFMNLFDEDKDLLPYVEWLPEEKAELEE